MTTIEQTELLAAGETLYASGNFSLMTANRWNGTDLHTTHGETLRITREDPEGDYWIGSLTRNGTVQMHAEVAGNASADLIATVAHAVWRHQ